MQEKAMAPKVYGGLRENAHAIGDLSDRYKRKDFSPDKREVSFRLAAA
jgi:hypothetical protein